MTSTFRSETKRLDIRLQNQMDPGTYNLNNKIDKKSHLINFSGKWV